MSNPRRRSILKPRNSVCPSDEIDPGDNTTGNLMLAPPSTTSPSKKPKERVSFSSRAEVLEIPTREQVRSMQTEGDSEDEANTTIYPTSDCDMEMTFCFVNDEEVEIYEDENNPTNINQTAHHAIPSNGVDMSMTMNRLDNMNQTAQPPSSSVNDTAPPLEDYEQEQTHHQNLPSHFRSVNFDAVDMSMTINKYERTYLNQTAQPTFYPDNSDVVDMSMTMNRCDHTYSNQTLQRTNSSENYEGEDMSMTMNRCDRTYVSQTAQPTIFPENSNLVDMSMTMNRCDHTYINQTPQATNSYYDGEDMSITMSRCDRTYASQTAQPTIFPENIDGVDMSMTMDEYDLINSNQPKKNYLQTDDTPLTMNRLDHTHVNKTTFPTSPSENFDGVDMSVTMNRRELTYANQTHRVEHTEGVDMDMTVHGHGLEGENKNRTVFYHSDLMDMEISSCHVEAPKIEVQMNVNVARPVPPKTEIHFRRDSKNIVRKQVAKSYGKFASVQTPKRKHLLVVKETHTAVETSLCLLEDLQLHHVNKGPTSKDVKLKKKELPTKSQCENKAAEDNDHQLNDTPEGTDQQLNEAAEIEQQLNEAPEIEQKLNETPEIEQQLNEAPEIEQKLNETPEIEQQLNKVPGIDQHLNEAAEETSQQLNEIVEIQQQLHEAAEEINQQLHEAAEIEQQLHETAEIQQHFNEAAEIEQQLNEAAEIQQQLNEEAEIEQQLNEAAEIEQQLNEAAEIEQQLNEAPEIEQQLNEAAEIQRQLNEAPEIEQQLNEAAEMERNLNDAAKETDRRLKRDAKEKKTKLLWTSIKS